MDFIPQALATLGLGLIFCVSVCTGIGQKGAPGADGFPGGHGCWGLNLGPPEEQPVLFTAEPLSQPSYLIAGFALFWGELFGF